MPESIYKKFFSPLDKGSGNYAPTRQQPAADSDAYQAVYIEELKKVNEELKQARRAALNLMEDAIASKEALRKSEEKYRTKLEQDVHDRTSELNATKENLQATLDSSLDIIQVFKAVRDDNGKIIDFTWELNNKQAIKQNGNVIGQSLLHEHPEFIPTGIFQRMIEVIETGTPQELEQYYEQFDGWFYQALVKSGDGVVMTSRNISDQKKAAREILNLKDEIAQKATDKYLRLFNTMEEAFVVIEFIKNKEGKPVNYIYREANPAFEKLVGLNPEEVIGKRMVDLFPTLDNSWALIFGEVADKQQSTRFEHYLKDNGRWYEVLAYPIFDDHIAVLYNDITERKKVEKALYESEERKTFLLKLSDELRTKSDPVEIEQTITQIALDYFSSDRCFYCEMEGDHFIIKRDAAKEGFPSVAGVYSMTDIPIFNAVVNGRKVFIVNDVNASNFVDESLRQLCIRLQIISFIGVPVIKNDVVVGILCIVQGATRNWTEFEIQLAEEVKERAWGAMEKAKAEEALHDSQVLLAKELADTKRLQKISSRMIEEGNVNALYQALIDSATELMHSDGASIQILNPDGNQLLLAASKGFHPESAKFWKYVPLNSTTCGKTVVISDVNKWEDVSKKDLEEYHRSGIVATQSTPLISRSGKCVGMMSTHWKKVFQPSERKLGLFELLTRQVADLIERKQSEDALRKSQERLQKAIQIETVGVLFFNDDGVILEANNASL